MTAIYVATSNPGKLRDFAAAAQAHGYALLAMPCMDRIPPPVEDELTFKGNACLKAIYYSRLAPGLDVLADDSGLEVDALDGSPGVRSARYAADAGLTEVAGVTHDEANNALLLDNMQHLAEADRAARYRCVLALARDGECLVTAEGAIEGRIAHQLRGDKGFGYDPLFYLPELGKTMAEINPAEKDKFSHRGRALRSLFSALSAGHSQP